MERIIHKYTLNMIHITAAFNDAETKITIYSKYPIKS